MHQPPEAWLNFAHFIGYCIAILFNCLLVWLALVLCRLKSNFSGMLMISAANILPGVFLPMPYNWLVSVVLTTMLVRSVTDAEGWIDVIKFIVASMIISIGLALLLLKLIFGTINITDIMKSEGGAPGQKQEIIAPTSAYEAYKDKLSPEELAEIERRVAEPIQ